MDLTYKQETKCIARHQAIRRAVQLLTTNRSSACCVRRSYVRDIYDLFIHQDESQQKTEALKIDINYIREWERMHCEYISSKRASELSVCYLSGPEPENDFKEFISLGILPQNIWAFECEQQTYLQALGSMHDADFLQPKLIKTSIEHFFECTPKRFDIVYIDACAPIISNKHALRCVSSMFKYHRLTSPGILISNFAGINITNLKERNEYIDIIARYMYVKKHDDSILVQSGKHIKFREGFALQKEVIEKNFDEFYGNFITALVCDAGSITIPTLRFTNSPYLRYLSNTDPLPEKAYQFSDINSIRNNTLYKFLASNKFLEQQNENENYAGIKRINKLSSELSGINNKFDLLSSSRKLFDIRNKDNGICENILEVIRFFESKNSIYQFLDVPATSLFFDSVINQLSYPMHYCTDSADRMTYVAKETRMFMDVLVFDECRYIYDWLPAIHQIPAAFSNPSWQYTFRFALDGLVKQRINYNNEFFFQGSVIEASENEFESKTFSARKKIN